MTKNIPFARQILIDYWEAHYELGELAASPPSDSEAEEYSKKRNRVHELGASRLALMESMDLTAFRALDNNVANSIYDMWAQIDSLGGLDG